MKRITFILCIILYPLISNAQIGFRLNVTPTYSYLFGIENNIVEGFLNYSNDDNVTYTLKDEDPFGKLLSMQLYYNIKDIELGIEGGGADLYSITFKSLHSNNGNTYYDGNRNSNKTIALFNPFIGYQKKKFIGQVGVGFCITHYSLALLPGVDSYFETKPQFNFSAGYITKVYKKLEIYSLLRFNQLWIFEKGEITSLGITLGIGF